MKKAEQNVTRKPKLPFPDRYWAPVCWQTVVGLLEHPSPEVAESAMSAAFQRTEALSEALTIVRHSVINERDWECIGETFELNACIMREAFDVLMRDGRSRGWICRDREEPAASEN